MATVIIALDTCLKCDNRRVETGDQVRINLDPDKFEASIITDYSPVTGVVTEVRLPTTDEPPSSAMVIEVEVEEADLPPGLDTISGCDIESISCYDCCASLSDRVTALEEAGPGLTTSLGGEGFDDNGKVPIFGPLGTRIATGTSRVVRSTLDTDWIDLRADSTYNGLVSKKGAFQYTLHFPSAAANRVVVMPDSSGTVVLGNGAGLSGSESAFRTALQLTNTALIAYNDILQYPAAITGLTGGGASNLDGITTVGVSTGTKRAVYISDSVHTYELKAGTDPDLVPFTIRPDDYNGVTNAKYWQLLNLTAQDITGSNSVTGSVLVVSDAASGFLGQVFATNITNNRNYQLPDTAGTFAIVSSSSGAIIGDQIAWETSNGDATAGSIGEMIQELVPALPTPVSLTTATSANMAFVNLTPGDWDVEGSVVFIESAATVTSRSAGINTVSATIPSDGTELVNSAATTTTSQSTSLTIPRKRVSISANTAVNLVVRASFSAGTVEAYGQISARRVR